MIRFHVKQLGTDPISTDWIHEITGDPSISTAVLEVSKLRAQYPDAEISVERNPVPERKKQKYVTFRIKDGDRMFYTIGFPLDKKDEQLAILTEKFCDAEITPTEFEQ